MNADSSQLHRDLERTKRLAAGLNDELSRATLRRYVEELTAEIGASAAYEITPSVPR